MNKKNKKAIREQEREKRKTVKKQKQTNKKSMTTPKPVRSKSQKTKNPAAHALWLAYKKQRNLANKQNHVPNKSQ